MGRDGVVEMAADGAVGAWKRRHFAGARQCRWRRVGKKEDKEAGKGS